MPKIITSLNKLKRSGRMCPEGWGTLLSGLGKSKADDEPLDAFDCLPIVGLRDTLWMLPTRAEYGHACRKLALAYALPVVHLADEAAAGPILASLERYLSGDLEGVEVLALVPEIYRPHTWYPITTADTWEDYGSAESATLAAVMTTYPDGSVTPYVVSMLAELASVQISPNRGEARNIIRANQTDQLAEFLSSPD